MGVQKFFTCIVGIAACLAANAAKPHLESEMSGPEYRALINARIKSGELRIRTADALDPVMKAGKRTLDWIDSINSWRPTGSKLELSTAATTGGIPIDHPKENNETIVLAKFSDAKLAMPAEMSKVIFGNGPLPKTAPVDDAIFLESARRLDSAYQYASRWILQRDYLDAYAYYAAKDIRGYYFLQREPEMNTKLANWNSLDAAKQAQLRDWLVGLCRNGWTSVEECTERFDRAVNAGKVPDFFSRHISAGQEMWNSFFRIQNARSDVSWNSKQPHLFEIPFLDPRKADVKAWLADNIQDEWKFQNWQLHLVFQTEEGLHTPHVVFEAGATPHVNAVGGDEITMDANRSIQEYLNRWTIRHEFGHVLGFPDCYVEFYDEDRGAMINYQIDVEDLMCSRRGHILERHVSDLARAYWKD